MYALFVCAIRCALTPSARRRLDLSAQLSGVHPELCVIEQLCAD